MEGAPAPELLGRYELIYLLGQGGMGEVHLARIRGAGGFEKLCIVKTILPQKGADPQFIDRFHHEAKLLVQLTHSSIAQVYDMGEAEGRLFMAIEYVSGVDLSRVEGRAWQLGSQIPVPIALLVGQKMAEALGYAHRKVGPDGTPLGIVHRDVSPQNVMVSYEGEVKVIDFGLAKSAARSKHTLPSTVMGKLGYMSPEQVRAERVDHRTDIYSCGVVVWEMLAGRPLFEMGTMPEMMAHMANPKIPSLAALRPDVSQDLDRVVARALAANPAERYSRADDFARALNEQAVRDGLTMGAEDAGTYLKDLCVEEFAEQRKLMSRLSSLARAPGATSNPSMQGPAKGLSGTAIRTPVSGLSGTAIRPPSEPPASAAPAAAPAPAAPPSNVIVASNAGAPAAAKRNVTGILLAVVVVFLVGAGVFAGAHWKEWTAPAAPVVATPAPATAPAPAPAVTPAPAPPPPVVATAAPTPAPSPPPPTATPAPSHPAKPARSHRTPAKAVAQAEPARTGDSPPPQAAPPQAEAPQAEPPPAAAPPPPVAPPVKALVAHAEMGRIAFAKRLVLYNDGNVTWHNCDVRLPDNRHYVTDAVTPHDSESILMTRFSQDGLHLDKPLDHVVIHCAEGAARVPIN